MTFFQGTQLYTGLHAEMWNYIDQQTWEAVVPVYYSMGLDKVTKGLALDLVTSPVLAFVTGTGTGSLFRVAGSKIRASYNVKDYVLVTSGVQIPTGNNNLSAQEQSVVSNMGTRQLGFMVTDVQSGINWNTTATSSFQINDDFIIGAGLGYLLRGRYTPVAGGGSYNPGDELTFTAGCDYTMLFSETKLKLMGEYMFTYYGVDRLNDTTKVFQASPRHTINLRGDLKPARGLRDLAVLSLNLFGENKVWTGTIQQPRGKTDIFTLSNYLYLSKMANISPYVLATVNLFVPNSDVPGQAFVAGLGAGGALQISRTLSVRAQAAVEGGSMNNNGLFGVELNGGINYVF
jgi:hypothetical protein